MVASLRASGFGVKKSMNFFYFKDYIPFLYNFLGDRITIEILFLFFLFFKFPGG